ITAPDGAMVVTAADLAKLKPIRPMLHKFNYVPVSQPVLAADVVRFVGEPIAAAVAASEDAAEDLVEAIEVAIVPADPVVDAHQALSDQAPRVHADTRHNVIVEGAIETPDFAAALARAHRLVRSETRSRRQNATPLEARAGH